jgi:hypothetical protein
MLSPPVTIKKNKKLVIVPVHILSGNRRTGNSNGSLSLLLLPEVLIKIMLCLFEASYFDI